MKLSAKIVIFFFLVVIILSTFIFLTSSYDNVKYKEICCSVLSLQEFSESVESHSESIIELSPYIIEKVEEKSNIYNPYKLLEELPEEMSELINSLFYDGPFRKFETLSSSSSSGKIYDMVFYDSFFLEEDHYYGLVYVNAFTDNWSFPAYIKEVIKINENLYAYEYWMMYI